jgi:tape measure domain-containing protein
VANSGKEAAFSVKLIDQVSGASRRIKGSLADIDAEIKKLGANTGGSRYQTAKFAAAQRKQTAASERAAKRAKKLADETGGAGKAAEAAGGNFTDFLKGSLGASAVMGAIGLVKDLAIGVLHAGDELIRFGQNSRFAFQQLAKHGATAEQLFGHAQDLAERFGLDVKDTTHAYANFLKLQFNPKQADAMIRMGSDLRGLGSTAEEVQGIFLALGQIKGKGKLQAQEMLQLAERGVSTELVQEEIGKALGGKTKAQVQKLQEQGKVTAEVGLKAIEDAIKRKLQEKELGDAGGLFADTMLDGIEGRFKAKATRVGLALVKRMTDPLTELEGRGLKSINDWLDSDTGKATIDKLGTGLEKAVGLADRLATSFGGGFLEGIKPLAAIIEPLIGSLGGPAGDKASDQLALIATDIGKLTAYALTGLAAIGAFSAALVGVGEELYREFSFLGDTLTNTFGGFAFALIDAWANIQAVFDSEGLGLAGKVVEIGKNVILGLVKGLWALSAEPVKAIAGIATSIIDAARHVFDSHSPSRVMMQLGFDTDEGLALGQEKRAGRVAAAAAAVAQTQIDAYQNAMHSSQWTAWDMPRPGGGFSAYGAGEAAAADAARAARSAGSKSGGFSWRGNIIVNVEGGGGQSDQERGQTIGDEIERVLERKFQAWASE